MAEVEMSERRSTDVWLPPLVQRWVDTYNANVLAAHIGLYTDDASIVVPGTTQTVIDLNPDGDKKVFWEVERALDAAAPNRQVRIDWASSRETTSAWRRHSSSTLAT